MIKKNPLIAHLDLKGIQYRQDYYEEYFRNISRLGYDGVLVEYEDVFPVRSAPMSEQPGEIWSREFLEQFLEAAAKVNLEIIPLQQCLGHLEYAFRQPENRRFSIPQGKLKDLHIGLPEARQWMKTLLGEMLEAHPGSRFVHLGMDEAGNFAAYAKALGRDPLDMFLDYLEELCSVCESHGKMPLIWSDMLEDHIAPENMERLLSLRERVILVPWNYTAGIKPESVVRFSGFRCSRQWLENPKDAPANVSPIWDGLLYFEDWAPDIRKLTCDFQISPWLMEPLFQAAIWKRLGFTVWGGAGGSITQDRSVLPYYHWRSANIRQWKQAVERHQLDGLIITQWQRSNSCSVPNLIPDVAWPVLAKAASADNSAKAFFPELDPGIVDSLIFRIGKCREDWSIEGTLIQEMSGHQPSEHAHEWKTILLMLRVMQIHKRIADCEEQVGCYAGMGRLNEPSWKAYIDRISDQREKLLGIRPEVREHLEKRYYGRALEEWLHKVFAIPSETLDRLEASVKADMAKLPSGSAARQ